MSSNTGFAALAQTSRDAALALVDQREQIAELRAELAQMQVEQRFNTLQWNLRDTIEQARAQEHRDELDQAEAELAATRAVWEDEVRRVVDTAEFDNRQNLRRISRLEAELAGARAALEDQFSAGVLDGLARARAAFVSVIAAPGSGTAAVAEAAPVPE